MGTVTGDIRSLGEVFRDICGMHVVDDGVEFAGEGIRGEVIRGGQDYPGARIFIPARIEAARILLQVYDIWILAKRFQFSGSKVAHAIGATFTRRGTPIPSSSILGLLEEFADSEAKRAQWRGFIKKGGLDEAVA